MKDSTNLDFLRTVAVLFVLGDHLLKFFGHPRLGSIDVNWIGGLGVMFFFVHTCLVLMRSLERHTGSAGTPGMVANFYIRRIFRIYPLSVLVLTFIVLLRIPSEKIVSAGMIALHIPSWKEYAVNALLLQNIWFDNNILGVLWSLPYEAQMYVLLPFLFLLFARNLRLIALLALWLLSLPIASRFDLLHFLPHFLPGVIAYVLCRKMRPRLPAWGWPIALLALTVIFFCGKPGVIWGRFICLLLGLAIPLFQDLTFQPLIAVAKRIATYSYGIYLTHLFCLWLAFMKLQFLPKPLQVFIFAVCLFTIPVALYHYFELPLIKLGATLSKALLTKKEVEREPEIATATSA